MIDEKFHRNRLFAGAPDAQLEAAHIDVEERGFAPGELLFAEGSAGDGVFLIAEGSVRISKAGRGGEQEVLDLAGAGDFVGEMAVIDGKARSAQATAATRTVAGVLSGEALARLMVAVPAVALNIGQSAVSRLRHADDQFIEKLLESERLSLLGRMMSSIVHDLRNPINTVLQATHYLKHQDNPGDPMVPKLAGVVEGAVGRMLDLTQEMLDFSRGVSTVRLEETTVADLLGSIEGEALNDLPAAGIEVVRELAYPGTFKIDRSRFQRLLLNLVKNAREAMPEGGTLTLAAEREGDEVTIRVSDTGCGMPPGIVDRVFESFVTHGKAHGTGLGMSIAKAVVDAHGGTIQVESTEGVGTTVHITVPAGGPAR